MQEKVDQNHRLVKIKTSVVEGKESPLHKNIVKNDVTEVTTYLQNHSLQGRRREIGKKLILDIPGEGLNGLSCLHLAACFGYKALVLVFLAEEIRVDHKDSSGNTALMWASRWGHTQTVQTLIEKGANTNLQNHNGSTALYWAVRYGHIKTVELLLDKGQANPNLKRKHGLNYPLIVASAYGNNAIVELLLLRRDGCIQCDVNKMNNRGEMSMHYAAREGHIGVLTTLMRYNAKIDEPNKQGDTPLLLAVQNDHIQVVSKLMFEDENVFNKYIEGFDIWHYAVDCMSNEMLDMLLAECKERKKDITRCNPLCIAAAKGKIDKVRFLLKYGGFETDSDGLTFLYHAAMYEKNEVIEQFHTHTNVSAQTLKGNTPLHIACRNGYDSTIKTLLNHNARVDKTNEYDLTPLHYATSSTKINVDTVRELVEYAYKNDHGLNILNVKDKDSNTCLQIACRNGCDSTIKILLEYNVNVDIKNNRGETPLHCAARCTSIKPDTVRELVTYAYNEHGSNILNVKDKDSNNCLHIAGMFATPAVMWEFRSVRLTDQNSKGFTPLHTAVRPEEPDALRK